MTLNELLPIVSIPLVIILVLIAVFSMWKKVPQDKAGVITGLKRRVITGGGGLVIPGVERIDYISLGNMPLRVDEREPVFSGRTNFRQHYGRYKSPQLTGSNTDSDRAVYREK